MTAHILEYSISTSPAGTLVTELLAAMIGVATLQLAAAASSTDVFGFVSVIKLTWSRVQRPGLAATGLSFGCFPFTRTASIAALMPSTVERDSANSHALRWLFRSLMANS